MASTIRPRRCPILRLVLALPLAFAAASCADPQQRRAVAVSACIAELALTVPPDAQLPTDPRIVTLEELELAARLVEGVEACRRRAAAESSGG